MKHKQFNTKTLKRGFLLGQSKKKKLVWSQISLVGLGGGATQSTPLSKRRSLKQDAAVSLPADS